MNDFLDKDCLCFDPFEGDFGSPGDHILKDKMVTSRKGGPCFCCNKDIVPGSRIRTMVAVFDGELCSYRWCNLCCHAMTMAEHDDGEEYERRLEIGRQLR